jgi:hypothetical protein
VSFLLDTNVVSEGSKVQPNLNVVLWLAGADEDRLFLSVITLAEIRRGIEMLPTGRRRERLGSWLADELTPRFEGRVLNIDNSVAQAWGVVMAHAQQIGTVLRTMDAFIAATAEVHGLTLATRNVKDFEQLGIPLFNPWNSSA